MLTLKTSSRFRRDYRRVKKRGYNLALLEKVINLLLAEEPLAKYYHDHELAGNYTGFRECHIEPDWLLIYKKSKDTLILTAQRTGTHSDLFDE